jgi:ethanolamine ammonia-lyase small subunit
MNSPDPENHLPADAVPSDPWARLRAATPARIGLASTGHSLPTADLLAFQLAHANARDAVHSAVDFDLLAAELAPLTKTLRVRSAAPDRATYLRRPDLGRRLAEPDKALLAEEQGTKPYDAAFIIGDGLSAAAIRNHAVPTLRDVLPRLAGWTLAPVILAEQARVALGDEVCMQVNARMAVVLIGERPGLTVADSLGIYLTWSPRPGRRDADRNCLSNIHANGLPYTQAADRLTWLMAMSRHLRLTGVALKENAGAALPPPAD